jgi:hypothetical protein
VKPDPIDPLDLLYDRARTLAERVSAGQLPFIEAVDFAYSAAEFAGTVDRCGADLVQQVLSRSFKRH